MSNNNDQKILELKKQIEQKKKKLGGTKKFNPITNCSIEFEGVRKNIQVLGKDEALLLALKLNALSKSADDLGVLESFVISGYHVSDWITDLVSKFELINRKDEEAKLKTLESKLDLLLSNEKKVELEIDEIKSLLG